MGSDPHSGRGAGLESAAGPQEGGPGAVSGGLEEHGFDAAAGAVAAAEESGGDDAGVVHHEAVAGARLQPGGASPTPGARLRTV